MFFLANMPNLAIFCYSKTDCTPLTELFNKHLNKIDPLSENLMRGNLGSIMKKLEETNNANWIIFTIQICQLAKKKLTAEQLMRKYCIDKALIIWRQNNRKNSKLAIRTKRIKKNSEEYQEEQWNKFFQCWPIEVRPIFVEYGQLFNELQREDDSFSAHVTALAQLFGMETKHCYNSNYDKKITNPFNAECCSLMGTPPATFRHILLSRAKLPPRLFYMLPEPEPYIYAQKSPIIRVVEPFIPLRAIQNVNEALVSKQISSAGIWPKQLAAKLCAIYGFPVRKKVAFPCSNGFTSLVLALRSANITHGADVLMPSLTFVAVSNAVLNVGANPVFVDSADESDYNPSWSLLMRSATSNTRAVIITHSYGCPAGDIELIAAGCKKHGWILIEDISECVGITTLTSTGVEKLLGTFGDYTCASLNSTKIVHGGDGGFVLARDPTVSARLQCLANHGHTKSLHFVHFEAAINGKINGLGAALACGVLDHLSEIIAHRCLVSTWYRKGMSQLFAKRLLVQMPRCGPRDTPWLFCVQCRTNSERTALRTHLAMEGIETRNMFFPLHLEPMFDAAFVDLDFPRAQLLGSTGFALPTHPELDKHKIHLIVRAIYQFFHLNDQYTDWKGDANTIAAHNDFKE